MGSVENISYTKYAKNIRQIKKRLKENPKTVMKGYIYQDLKYEFYPLIMLQIG